MKGTSEQPIMNPVEDIESASSSEGDEEFNASYFVALQTMPCMGSDMEDEEGTGLDYETLVEQEGLAHILKTVPAGSYLVPFASYLDTVERVVLMKPLDARKVVDIDTLVIRSEDLQVLGKVIEVFGPVEAPLYSVLCQPEYLLDSILKSGQIFSYMPEQGSLVQTEELRAQKITDADNVEGGDEQFYSDDEAEAAAKKRGKAKAKRPNPDLEPGEIDE